MGRCKEGRVRDEEDSKLVITVYFSSLVLTKNKLLIVAHQSSTYFGCLSNKLATILAKSGLFPSP